MKKYWFGVLFLANILVFLLTGSKTGMAVTAFAVLMAAVLVSFPGCRKKAGLWTDGGAAWWVYRYCICCGSLQ